MYDYEPPQRQRPQRNWPGMIIILAVLGFIILAMWWMSENFGATFAMAVAGSLVGAGIVALGVMLNQKNTQVTLASAASFNRDLAMTEKARQGTYKEGARLERDAFNQRARLELIDARRVDQLAQQRAQMLRLPDKQPPAQQMPPAWLFDDEDADGQPDARWYE
jgi:hypothetical protein